MTVISMSFPFRRAHAWPLRWLAVLLTGLALFGAELAVFVDTGDPIYLPSLLLLGAAIVPATVTTLVTELERAPRPSFARVATALVLGGVVGGVLAGQLEFDTARVFGSLPYVMIGLIEESAKLAVAVLLLAWRRPRPSAFDGLVVGVAVGSGFAAMETMGYAFVALLSTGGHLQAVDNLLLARAASGLGGHAVWTGLACAAWFAVRGAGHRWLGWGRFVGTFGAVVGLHALWDASARGHGYLAVGATGLTLLAVTTWWLYRRAGRAPVDALGDANRVAQPKRVGALPSGHD